MVPTVLGPQFDRLFGANVVFNARARQYSRGECLLGLEGSVAVAEKHAHRIRIAVDRDEIGLAIAVDIARQDR